MVGADLHQLPICPRLLPGPPPTQWQVLMDTYSYSQTKITPKLFPGYPQGIPHQIEGTNGRTDYFQTKITPRLFPGTPPTHWQVLMDTHTSPNLRLLPSYSLPQINWPVWF